MNILHTTTTTVTPKRDRCPRCKAVLYKKDCDCGFKTPTKSNCYQSNYKKTNFATAQHQCYLCQSKENLEKHPVYNDKGRCYPEEQWLCLSCRNIQWAKVMMQSHPSVMLSDNPAAKHVRSILHK